MKNHYIKALQLFWYLEMNSNESLFINSMMLKDDDTHSISEIELRNRLNGLEDKIQKLQSELASLMKKRVSLQSMLDALNADEVIPPPLMDSDESENFSSGIEKAEFMLDLFSPRRDVFASREWSKSKKGVGYYPACGNFLKKGCPTLAFLFPGRNEAGAHSYSAILA